MESREERHYKNKVHRVLAHSYTLYLVLFLVGVTLDFVFKVKIFSDSFMVPVGLFFLVFSSLLIIWAQKTGRDLRKFTEKKKEHFRRGPYAYTRFPTQWGLFLLMLGFGIITNAFFVIVSTIMSLLIARLLFVTKHDNILIEKYGEAYKEYKKLVKF